MKIESTSSHQLQGQSSHRANVEKSQAETTAAAEPTSPTSDTDAVVVDFGTEQKGVIRNLLEGHYKGVADVRLRINFFDELQALQQTKVATNLSDGFATLTASVDTAIDEFTKINELSEETALALEALRGEFKTSTEGLLSAWDGTTDIASALKASSDTFLSSLRSLLVPPPSDPATELTSTPPVAGEELSGESLENPPSPTETFLTSLEGLFATAAQEFANLTAPSDGLPPLSTPSGHGAAYQKFLAIYEGLLFGNSTSGSTSESAAPTDVVA